MPKPLMLLKHCTKIWRKVWQIDMCKSILSVRKEPDQLGAQQIGFPSTELNPLIWKFLWSFDAYTRGKVKIQCLYEVWLLQTLRSTTMHLKCSLTYSFQLTVFNSHPTFLSQSISWFTLKCVTLQKPNWLSDENRKTQTPLCFPEQEVLQYVKWASRWLPVLPKQPRKREKENQKATS